MRQATVHHEEGGGVPPASFEQDVPLPWRNPYREIFVRISFDCLGLPIGRKKTWYRFSNDPLMPGDPTKFTSFGWLRSDEDKNYHQLRDIRTVEMMLAGCCPPQILLEYMGTEGIPT